MSTSSPTNTTNYGLVKPSYGYQDWGDVLNSNFDLIDTTMKNNSNKIVTLLTPPYIFTATTDNTTHIPINITGINLSTAIYEVFHSGYLLEKDVNYSVNTDNVSIDLGWGLNAGETIIFKYFGQTT